MDGAYMRALESGCTSLSAPADQPHGQRVAVRDPLGTLLELATALWRRIGVGCRTPVRRAVAGCAA